MKAYQTMKELEDENVRLRAELDAAVKAKEEAEERVDHWQEEHRDMVSRWQRMTEERNGLRAALEQVEWVYDGSLWACPWCRAWRANGHKPDCARQLALSPEPKGENDNGL